VTKTKQFANRFRKANLKNQEELNIMNVQFDKFREEFTLEERKLAMQLKSVEKRGENV
jgi:hypothetical protein